MQGIFHSSQEQAIKDKSKEDLLYKKEGPGYPGPSLLQIRL